MPRLRGGRRPPPDRTPELALRLAVLLQAGVAPTAAWRFLADAGEPDALRVLAVHDAGEELGAAIALVGPRWAPIAAAWRVAIGVGAPLADGLRAIADALRDANDGRDDVGVALAEPAATSRLMSWLPLVAVAIGVALGFDTVGVLTTTPAGIACLVAGVALMAGAHRWTARLVRAARPGDEVPGLDAELIAIALSGGVSIERARALVAGAGARTPRDDAEIDRILSLSRSAGAPAVELLRASAAMARQRARTEGRMRAARLSARLLLPLGVCVLPAFVVLGVAPMLMSILSTTSLGL